MDEFLCPGSGAFTDEVTDAAVRLLAGAGVERLSIGVVASGLGMTRQGLTQRLKIEIIDARRDSSPAAFLHEIVATNFSHRFVDWRVSALYDEVPRLVVPATASERAAVRIWLAIRELARSDWMKGHPDTAEVVAFAQRHLHRRTQIALQNWVGQRIGSTTISSLLALTDGLHLAVAAPVSPMAAAVAQMTLDREIRHLHQTRAPTAA